MHKIEVDITPHPNVLTVLGEIEFKPIQCIAELVDNSIDGFLSMARLGTPINNPQVHVAFGRDTVVVKDNGPGMSIDELEMAVKAGWTTQEKYGSLGLYGIGFNIATARLGRLTTIWTTRVGDNLWYGLEIDLQELARGGTYKIQVLTRAKSDPQQSGTEVEVLQIKQDWKGQFENTSWVRTNITDKLANIYSTMLRDENPRPVKFNLYVNNKKVNAWEHCVWPADLEVFKKDEALVRPIQEFDHTLGEKYISKSTGKVYETKEGLDETDLIEVPERVYGWLGIQRYADEKEYGVDILRNGRKIEIGCKDIFDWEDPDGNNIHEYVIDDPRQRGRIVGEIHLDHGYVHYTKHRFEREHLSWKQLMQVVRHNEPLTKRETYGYTDVNRSPLGILFRVFRRNSPARGGLYKDILFIKDNEKAKKWAQEYRKGIAEYRDIKKWKEELERSDEINSLTPKKESKGSKESSGASGSGADEAAGNFILDLGDKEPNTASPLPLDEIDSNFERQEGSAAAEPADIIQSFQEPASAPHRVLLPDLSLHITGIGLSGRPYDVEVYAIDNPNNSSGGPAWLGTLTEKNVYEIEVNLQHPAFNSTSLQVHDAVLAQVAYLITVEETASVGTRSGISYGEVLVALRARYAKADSLESNYMRIEIDALRRQIIGKLAKSLTERQQREIVSSLPSGDPQRIELAYARGPKNVPIISYLDMKNLVLLFQRQPDTFFNAGCFNRDWTPSFLESNTILLDEHRNRLIRDLNLPLIELEEFVNDLTIELTKPYLGLIRACINRVKEYLAE